MGRYRVYRREPIERGKWYFSSICQGCGKPHYLIDDEGGPSAISFVGDGEISAPCNRCAHDNIYKPSELKTQQASESLPGTHLPRVKVSKSSRKPIAIAYPKATVTMGVGYVEDRPQAAAIIARIVTGWADIEVQCARLLAELMGTNVPPAAAVFGSLRSSRAQHDALEAAAKVVLNIQDLELFSAHMARRASLEKERNDLAHGCFGVSLSIPDHVVWVAQSDYLNYSAAFETDPEAFKKFRSKQFVYELGTLERIAQEIEEFYNQLGFFRGYLDGNLY